MIQNGSTYDMMHHLTREDLDNFREYISYHIMQNDYIGDLFDWIKFKPEDLSYILNGNVMYPLGFTLLDVASKVWKNGAYRDIEYCRENVHTEFVNENAKRLPIVKFLVYLGAVRTNYFYDEIQSIYYKFPVDKHHIQTYIEGKLFSTKNRIKFMRKHRKTQKTVVKIQKKLREYFDNRCSMNNDNDRNNNCREMRIARRKEWICPICLDSNTHSNKLVLNCKHKFHAKCFLTYFIQKMRTNIIVENMNCPMCRSCIQ